MASTPETFFVDHAHFNLNHTHIFENIKKHLNTRPFFLDAFPFLANSVGKVELEISL